MCISSMGPSSEWQDNITFFIIYIYFKYIFETRQTWIRTISEECTKKTTKDKNDVPKSAQMKKTPTEYYLFSFFFGFCFCFLTIIFFFDLKYFYFWQMPIINYFPYVCFFLWFFTTYDFFLLLSLLLSCE